MKKLFDTYTGSDCPVSCRRIPEYGRRCGMSMAGFTLTELMVVVGIIGLLTTIAIPSYLRMQPHMRLRAAARDVASAMQIARMSAISYNTPVRVLYGIDSNNLIIQKKSGGSWVNTSSTVSSRDWIDIDVIVASGGIKDEENLVNSPAGYLSIEYRPDGVTNIDLVTNKRALYMRNERRPKNGYEYYRVLVEWNGLIKIQKLSPGGAEWVRG